MVVSVSSQAMADVASRAPTAVPAAVSRSAHEFEAMTIGQMLQPMFETLEQGGLFDGGPAEQTLRPMLITEFAKMMEARGGLGLEGPLERAMMQAKERSR